MANARTSYEHNAYDRSLSVYGHFYPNGGAALSTTKGTGGTFSRTGVGVHTFVFSEPVPIGAYWYPEAKLNMGTPNGSYACVTAVSQSSSTGIITVTIGTFNAAHAAADIAAHATNVVTFEMKVRLQGP
jgi:hypothetical protein